MTEQNRIRPALRFSLFYAGAALLLFTAEALIALYVSGGFVRYTLGDVLAVGLVYCAALTFLKTTRMTAACGAFALATLIEVSQGANLLGRTALSNSHLAQLILGSTFSWGDMMAYTAGGVVFFLADEIIRRIFARAASHCSPLDSLSAGHGRVRPSASNCAPLA